MAATSEGAGGWFAPTGAALALTVIYVVVLSIPLGVATDLGLSGSELTGWILVLYGVPGVLSFALAWRLRQPLLLTGNLFVLVFVASLGGELSWAELIGASMTAGAAVLVLGLLGVTDRLASWLPAPVVFGVLAGAVLPFFVGLFDALADLRMVVGAMLVTYLAGRRLVEPRIPALLPTLVVGLAAAGLTGELGAPATGLTLPRPALTSPVFSIGAVLTAAPVIVALIALQANAPSIVFLRAQGYAPPERTLTVVSGVGTLLGSLFGPMGVSLSLPATALTAGPDAGERSHRHRAAILAGGTAVVVALLAGYAAELETIIARPLLLGMIGLAVVGVFISALQHVVTGPLTLGPVFAFGIAVSDLSMLGLGPFFWALVVGLVISRVVEHDAWARRRAGEPGPRTRSTRGSALRLRGRRPDAPGRAPPGAR